MHCMTSALLLGLLPFSVLAHYPGGHDGSPQERERNTAHDFFAQQAARHPPLLQRRDFDSIHERDALKLPGLSSPGKMLSGGKHPSTTPSHGKSSHGEPAHEGPTHKKHSHGKSAHSKHPSQPFTNSSPDSPSFGQTYFPSAGTTAIQALPGVLQGIDGLVNAIKGQPDPAQKRNLLHRQLMAHAADAESRGGRGL